MKAAILTSSIGGKIEQEEGVRVSCAFEDTNGFLTKLKGLFSFVDSFLFVSSDPKAYEITEGYASLLKQSFELSGIPVKNFTIIDYRFKGDLTSLIKNADIVFLAGGHVPTQNAYFKEIKLKEKLKHFKGVLIGQSAGSMNCSKKVYIQPEYEHELLNKKFKKHARGLGLTKIHIMPHINTAKDYQICGITPYEMSIKDSYKYPHFGIADGAFIEIKKGAVIVYGQTLYFKRGKVKPFCCDGQSCVLSKK